MENEEKQVGISFKVTKKFRTKANIASQVLDKPVVEICIEALEAAIAKAGVKV